MFLEKYKRLDNLCKQLFRSERGVSSYIEEMERCDYFSTKIAGWNDDYKKLKKYRYMRNRIVHENNIDEETLCTETDVIWIEQFYERIMNCNDPLALYRKRREEKKTVSPMKKTTHPISAVEYKKISDEKTILLKIGICMLFLIIVGIIVYIFLN